MTNIKFDANTFDRFDEKAFHHFFTVESTMLNQDRIIVETYERKNELESMVYTWKEKLAGSHQQYAEPNSIPAILQYLEETGNWLYDEGQNASRGTYIEKLDHVRAKVGDIQQRYLAFENLAHEVSELVACLKHNFEFLNSLVRNPLI